MVNIKSTSSVLTSPMTREWIKSGQWFEYKGELYIAFDWKIDASFNPPKPMLNALCFGTQYGTIHALFGEDDGTNVNVVWDSNVNITYSLAPNK